MVGWPARLRQRRRWSGRCPLLLQLIGLAGAAQGRAGAVVERGRATFTEPPHPLSDGPADIRRYEFAVEEANASPQD